MTSSRVLISGSIAYDNIMVFPGQFKDHILPDKVHMLNVAFLTPELKREYGGTAANIAYNLKALGGDPYMLATVGAKDGAEYINRLKGWELDLEGVVIIENAYTAQAFITTDLSDNQITAFHPGAMNQAHESQPTAAALGLVSPNGKSAMQGHARQMKALGVPFIFDPGQGLPMYSGDELLAFFADAQAITVNDYEAQMLCEKTGLDLTAIAAKVQALIVTLGGEGAMIYHNGQSEKIAAASIAKAVDPTGCGDAFRAGLVFGRTKGLSWVDAAKIGSIMGAIKIEHHGAQNHSPNRSVIAKRLQETYGLVLPE
jgi:adenosine kinase